MQKTQDIRIETYNYPLPESRIAKYPLANRDQSKLLLYQEGEIVEHTFAQLPSLLPMGSILVFNNTKVIQARLHFRKETGAQIEVFCLEPNTPADYALSFQSRGKCSWNCLIGNAKRWKEGGLKQLLLVKGEEITLQATRMESNGESHQVCFEWNSSEITFGEILEHLGELPIPPYLNRETQESDLERYQTVYSKIEGSVAAPTAGLHFTPQVLEQIKQRGVETLELTLHVGAGTFKPVKADTIAEHNMHTEFISVERSLIERIIANPSRVIAVGTTSVRTLESLYYIGETLERDPDASADSLPVKQWQPYQENTIIDPTKALQNIVEYLNRNNLNRLVTSTQILIAPGYNYKIVKGIITNFHQPQSTLLLLVSAFVDGHWQEIYDYALSHDFRFLSYGDSSLLLPNKL